MRLVITSLILACALGCSTNTDGNAIPTDRLYFPSVLLQNGKKLYVVNSNLDLQFSSGSISTINLDTNKIENVQTTPSLPGQAIFLKSSSTILTTSQKEATLVHNGVSILSLGYNAPYYLTTNSDQSAGLLGYLTNTFSESWDANKFSLVADQPDLQYFTLSSGSTQITQSFQLANCFPAPQRPTRRVGRVGDIKIVNNNAYIAFDFVIDDPNDKTKAYKHAFLMRTPVAALSQGNLCPEPKALFDISTTEKAQAIRSLVISQDEQTAYVLLDEDPTLAKISLNSDINQWTVAARFATCKGPTTLKLSPDSLTLMVACPKSNELAAYNATDISLFGKSSMPEAKGGPLDILFDQTQAGRIFVTYPQDHQIGIFTYENASASKRSLTSGQWLQLSR